MLRQYLLSRYLVSRGNYILITNVGVSKKSISKSAKFLTPQNSEAVLPTNMYLQHSSCRHIVQSHGCKDTKMILNLFSKNSEPVNGDRRKVYNRSKI